MISNTTKRNLLQGLLSITLFMGLQSLIYAQRNVPAFGSIDTSFNFGYDFYTHDSLRTNMRGIATNIFNNSDGTFMIGGDLYRFNAKNTNRAIKIDGNGRLLTDFNISLPILNRNSDVRTIHKTADGKYYLGGDFGYSQGNRNPIEVNPFNYLVRVYPNGTTDSSFQANIAPHSFVTKVKPVENGKVLVGGRISFSNRQGIFLLVRLNSDGSFDETFKPVSAIHQPPLHDFIVLNNGSILISFYDIWNSNNFLCLLPNGDLNTVFRSKNNRGFRSVFQLLPNNQILVVDTKLEHINTSSPTAIRVLNEAGDLVRTINFLNYDGIPLMRNNAIAPFENGKIMIPVYKNRNTVICRLNSDFSLDSSFQHIIEKYNEINFIQLLPNGNYLLSYKTQEFNGSMLKILSPTGQELDSYYKILGFEYGSESITLSVDPNKNIYSISNHSRYNSYHYRSNIKKIKPNGTLDTSYKFLSNRNAFNKFFWNFTPKNIYATNDNGLLLLGDVRDFRGHQIVDTKNFVFRVDANGDRDMNFRESILSRNSNGILSIKESINGIYHFSSLNSATHNPEIISLNNDGSKAEVCIPEQGYISALHIALDGTHLAANQYLNNEGKLVFKLVKFDINGLARTEFANNTPLEGIVYDLKQQEDGKILAIGYFLNSSTHEQRTFIRFNANGSIDASFNVPFITKTNCFAQVELLNNNKGFIVSNYNVTDDRPHTYKKVILVLNNDGTYNDRHLFKNFGRNDFRAHPPRIIESQDKVSLFRFDRNTVLIAGEYVKYDEFDMGHIGRYFINFDERPALLSEGIQDGNSSSLMNGMNELGNTIDKGSSVFNVFPNPSVGVINIRSRANDSHSFQIMNAMGQVMLNEVCPKGGMQMNTTPMQKGIYFIKFDNGETYRLSLN